MTSLGEKRSYKHCTNEAPIRLTCFNTGCWLDAQVLNHCLEGVCVKSNFDFHPGATVLIRVEKYPSNGSRTCDLEGIPTISLGEVKWCKETPDAISSSYEVGVKYYAPEY